MFLTQSSLLALFSVSLADYQGFKFFPSPFPFSSRFFLFILYVFFIFHMRRYLVLLFGLLLVFVFLFFPPLVTIDVLTETNMLSINLQLGVLIVMETFLFPKIKFCTRESLSYSQYEVLAFL